MRTLAEMFGFRPTKFLPNGCGPAKGFSAKLVPDQFMGVGYDDCCDLHDLGYHVGKGGFLGLFYAKPVVDYKLAKCVFDRMHLNTRVLYNHRIYGRAATMFLASLIVPPIYFFGVQLLGWTPLTWPWKERPMPSHEDLERLLAHNRND